MCGWGGGYWKDCFLKQGQDQSCPAQRGRFCNSPGIPSDWTEGPSHGSRAERTADGDAVRIIGKLSYEVRLKVCLNCSW